MALQISNKFGIFEINGNLSGNNIKSFNHHFEHLLQTTDQVILSVDNVKKIDSFGVKAVTKLHKKAMLLNKIFYVIGNNNKAILKAFGRNTYILKND